MRLASPRRGQSLRQDLIWRTWLLVTLTFVAFAVAAYLTVFSPMVDELAASAMRQGSHVAREQVEGMFAQIDRVANDAREWGRNRNYNLDDVWQFNHLFIPFLNRRPRITSLLVAEDSGRELMLLKMPDGEWRNRITDPRQGDHRQQWLQWRDFNTLRAEEWRDSDYDPRFAALVSGGDGAGAGRRPPLDRSLPVLHHPGTRHDRLGALARSGEPARLRSGGGFETARPVPLHPRTDDQPQQSGGGHPARRPLARPAASPWRAGRRRPQGRHVENRRRTGLYLPGQGDRTLATGRHAQRPGSFLLGGGRTLGQLLPAGGTAQPNAVHRRHGPAQRFHPAESARQPGLRRPVRRDAAAGFPDVRPVRAAGGATPRNPGRRQRTDRPAGTGTAGGAAALLARGGHPGRRPGPHAANAAGQPSRPGTGQRRAGAQGGRADPRTGARKNRRPRKRLAPRACFWPTCRTKSAPR